MKPNVYILSGAGLSADSGLATFRSGNNATWSHVDLNVVCNYHTWQENKEAVFDFYRSRRIEYSEAMPNDGHKVLVEWQQRWPDRVYLLTQNVDDLLEKAGAFDVMHLHGEIGKLRCTSCDYTWEASIDDYHVETECPKCYNSRNVKPAIVMFNEPAPEYMKLLALQATMQPQDIFIVVGTALQVVRLDRCLPDYRVGNGYEFNWQVNPEPVYHNSFGVIEAMKAGPGLRNLEQQLVELM